MSQELKLRVYNTIIILTVLHARESGALRKKTQLSNNYTENEAK